MSVSGPDSGATPETAPQSAHDSRPARVGVQLQQQHATYREIRRACAPLRDLLAWRDEHRRG